MDKLPRDICAPVDAVGIGKLGGESTDRSGYLKDLDFFRQPLVSTSTAMTFPSPLTAASAPDIQGELVTFEVSPGRFGVSFDEDSGLITEVDAGEQADRLGVKPGWKMIMIDGLPWRDELLKQKLASFMPYRITFSRGAQLPGNTYSYPMLLPASLRTPSPTLPYVGWSPAQT
jgi:hypothetical protein